MKKTIILTSMLSVLGFCSCAAQTETPSEAVVKVNLPEGFKPSEFQIISASIADMAKDVRLARQNASTTTHKVEGRSMTIPVAITVPSTFVMGYQGQEGQIEWYAAPGDTIVVDILSEHPQSVNITGTALMNDLNRLSAGYDPLMAEYMTISAKGESGSEAKLDSLLQKADAMLTDFAKANLNSPALPAVLRQMWDKGSLFFDLYNQMGPEAKSSIVLPLADAVIPRAQEAMELEQFEKNLASGNVEAPAFTLPDLDGKMVSLSDFRGKWVVLDFWGSWCPWCIKGFPALKEAYNKAGGAFEVIGVDCRDSKEAWKAAVEKYKLPWVNVYNAVPRGQDDPLLANYHVVGFPTKAIVNPEGKLVNVTIGEDSSFFKKLEDMMNAGK